MLPATAGAQPPCSAGEAEAIFVDQLKLGVIRGITSLSGPECIFEVLATFEANSAALNAHARHNLDVFAEAVRDPSLVETQFMVEGHADESGSADYNQTLSLRRATVVVEYLFSIGVPSTKLMITAYGESRPLDPEEPTAPENRRVQVRFASQP